MNVKSIIYTHFVLILFSVYLFIFCSMLMTDVFVKLSITFHSMINKHNKLQIARAWVWVGKGVKMEIRVIFPPI